MARVDIGVNIAIVAVYELPIKVQTFFLICLQIFLGQ